MTEKEKWDDFWEKLGLRVKKEVNPLLGSGEKTSLGSYNIFEPETTKPFSEYGNQSLTVGERPTGELLNVDSTTSHELEAEKINAIKQKTSRGFKTFDINPNLLSRSDFFCVYDDDVLSRFVGSQTPVETTPTRKFDNEGAPVNQQAVAAPYWRTVEIPFEGTFLKVEYLPSRKNDFWSFNRFNQSQGFTSPTVKTQNSLGFEYNFSSEPLILVEFENPQGRPIIAKHGDVYKTYFTTTFITFKQTSARIRITIGYNSEIESYDDRPYNLSTWGGRGFTTNDTLTPKQFCLTDKDIFPLTTYTGVTIPATTATTTLFTVLANAGFLSPFDCGVVPVWITEIECTPYIMDMNADKFLVDIDFYKWPIDTATAAPVGSTPIERIASGQCYVEQIASGSFIEKFTWTGEPIRVGLLHEEGIVLQLRVTYQNGPGPVTNNRRLKFSVHGYTLNQIEVTNSGGFGYAHAQTFLTENPWPQDLVLNETVT